MMKWFAKVSMALTFGAFLAVVAGCQKDKAAPADAEQPEAVPTAEAVVEEVAPAVEQPATDAPKDHPAH